MHLDTITELLDIPNHKAAVAIMTEDRIYVILERVEDTPRSVQGAARFMGHLFTVRMLFLLRI